MDLSLSLCPVKVAAGGTNRKMDDSMEQNSGKFQSQEYLYYGLRKL